MTENRNSQSIEGSFHKHGGDHALPEAEEKSKKANNKDKTTNILKTHHFFFAKKVNPNCENIKGNVDIFPVGTDFSKTRLWSPHVLCYLRLGIPPNLPGTNSGTKRDVLRLVLRRVIVRVC